jgi:hypothetical protein
MAFDLMSRQKNLFGLGAKEVYIGTSSREYPGWRRMIYDKSRYISHIAWKPQYRTS